MSDKEVLKYQKAADIAVDVVIVGGGPAGSMVAKNCAGHGMRTLLLEKKKLPRHKMCTGIFPPIMVKTLIEEGFGVIPDWVLTDPPVLSGIQWHMSPLCDSNESSVDTPIVHTWRKDLDYWMNLKAKEQGAEIWDEALVSDIVQGNGSIIVKARRPEEQQIIKSKFVVGADSSYSVVRTRLFPGLGINYKSVYVECHQGALDLDKRYWHIFGQRLAPGEYKSNDFADVIHKGDCFVIEASEYATPAKKIMSAIKKTLIEKYGLKPESKPLWTSGTVMAVLYDELLSGKFIPAKGNVILVGDAGGFTPEGGGGLEMALKSGALAASAIIEAADTSQEAESIYVESLKPVIEFLNKSGFIPLA